MMAFKSVHQQTSYTCHIPHIEQVKVKPSPRHEGARVWYTYMYLISGFRGAKFLRVTDPQHTPLEWTPVHRSTPSVYRYLVSAGWTETF